VVFRLASKPERLSREAQRAITKAAGRDQYHQVHNIVVVADQAEPDHSA
jgi:hypothetical protein